MNKIKIYDLNAFIGQHYSEYEAFRYKKAAIFEGPHGVVFSEEEAVHQRANRITDSVVVPLCQKAEEKDGHITMAIRASAEMTVSLDEIVSKAPYEEKTMEEFFARRDYNPRCQDNYAILMNSLRNIGFDLKGYFTEKLSLDEQMDKAEAVSTANFKPDCPLIGQNGNIFNLMAIASLTLRQNGMPEQAKEMSKRIVDTAQSYDEALCIIGEYVNITSVDKNREHGTVTRDANEI